MEPVMIVQVEAKHIEAGGRFCAQRCPLALAIDEHLADNFKSLVLYNREERKWSIVIGDVASREGEKIKVNQIIRIGMHVGLIAWIERFDGMREVYPFNFEIFVPDKCLKNPRLQHLEHGDWIDRFSYQMGTLTESAILRKRR